VKYKIIFFKSKLLQLLTFYQWLVTLLLQSSTNENLLLNSKSHISKHLITSGATVLWYYHIGFYLNEPRRNGSTTDVWKVSAFWMLLSSKESYTKQNRRRLVVLHATEFHSLHATVYSSHDTTLTVWKLFTKKKQMFYGLPHRDAATYICE